MDVPVEINKSPISIVVNYVVNVGERSDLVEETDYVLDQKAQITIINVEVVGEMVNHCEINGMVRMEIEMVVRANEVVKLLKNVGKQ